ncbi:MAG: polyhydroxyalkanoate synthesis repressor PhaR, partial [Pseudomonadota bacterium]
FLAASFEMLRDGQSKMMDQMGAMNPMSTMPGFEAMKAQQEAFLKAMTGGMSNWSGPSMEEDGEGEEDLDAIKKQLAELQKKLAKL